MKNLSISVIFDTLFFSFCAYLLFFSLFNYALPRNASIILAITFCAVAGVLSFKILINKDKIKRKTKVEKQRFEEVITQFHFMENAEVLAFMKKVFDKANLLCEVVNGHLHFEKEKRIAIFKFGFRPVGKADVVRAFNRLKKGYQVELYASEFDNETKRFASLFNGDVVLKDANYLFSLLSAYDIFPEIKVVLKKEKLKLKDIKENLLDKSKRKTYLGFGITFLLLSYISPIRWYYVVSASIMLTMCLICILFGKSKPIKE